MSGINQALRDHVTSSRFVLTIATSHIAALVRIDRELTVNHSIDDAIKHGTLGTSTPSRDHPLARIFNLPGSHGLMSRGLITHCMPARPGTKPRDIWTITPAGYAVITLLKEAGIWQEYADALPPVPAQPVKAQRRRKAA